MSLKQPKIAQAQEISLKGPISPKISKIIKISKTTKFYKNGPKSPDWAKLVQNHPNGADSPPKTPITLWTTPTIKFCCIRTELLEVCFIWTCLHRLARFLCLCTAPPTLPTSHSGGESGPFWLFCTKLAQVGDFGPFL